MSETPIIDKLIQELCQRVYQPTAEEIVPLERIRALAMAHLSRIIRDGISDNALYSESCKLAEEVRDICTREINKVAKPTESTSDVPGIPGTSFRELTTDEYGILYSGVSVWIASHDLTERQNTLRSLLYLLHSGKLVVRTD